MAGKFFDRAQCLAGWFWWRRHCKCLPFQGWFLEPEARLMLQKRRGKDRICDSMNGHGLEFSYKTTIANPGAAVLKIDKVIGVLWPIPVRWILRFAGAFSFAVAILSHLSLKTEASYSFQVDGARRRTYTCVVGRTTARRIRRSTPPWQTACPGF